MCLVWFVRSRIHAPHAPTKLDFASKSPKRILLKMGQRQNLPGEIFDEASGAISVAAQVAFAQLTQVAAANRQCEHRAGQ